MMQNQQQETVQLTQTLNLPLSIALAVSTIIGSGLMGLPGLAIDAAGPQGALAAWLVTIVLSIPLMLVFLELTLTGQSAGGLATYIGVAFGGRARSAAAILIALTFALCIPLGTLMGAYYIADIFNLSGRSPYIISFIILISCTAINIVGVKPSSFVNSLSVIALIAFVTAMVLLNLPHFQTGINAGIALGVGNFTNIPISQLWTASAILFWAFLGWENLSFGSEEIKGGNGLIRAVFWISFVIVTILYVMLAFVTSGAAINGLSVNGVSGLLALFEGSRYERPVHILIVIVVVANVNAWVFAASRLYFGMARDGVFPKFLSHRSQNGMPSYSLSTLLVIYGLVTTSIAFNFFELETGLMVANQNFLVLYLGAVVCLYKLSPRLWSKLLAVIGFICCALFLSGFGVMLIIPISVGSAGFIFSSAKTRA